MMYPTMPSELQRLFHYKIENFATLTCMIDIPNMPPPRRHAFNYGEREVRSIVAVVGRAHLRGIRLFWRQMTELK